MLFRISRLSSYDFFLFWLQEPVYDQRNGDKREERKRKDSEKERERTKPATREWDVGKESNKDRNRSRSRDRRRRHSGKRSPTPLKGTIILTLFSFSLNQL